MTAQNGRLQPPKIDASPAPPTGVDPDPTQVAGAPVGTATPTFAAGNNAAFACAGNGISQTKQITRQIFSAPGTLCQ